MVQVNDARLTAKPLNLKDNGFELAHWPTPVTDFYDSEVIRTEYYDDTAALVKSATGAKDVFVFQHMRRDSELHNKAENGQTAVAHGAVQRVHADYTPDNGPEKLRQLEESGHVPKGIAAGRRWSVVNVWRSIDTKRPVQALPLAVLDASTVSADDTFTYALVMNEATPPLVGFNNGVSFSKEHSWYYYSAMQHEEALLFYTYDGSFQTSKPRFVFHSAVTDPSSPPDAPPRKSIECRCLAIF